MKVGNVVRINDLCILTRLHDAIGTVVKGPFYEEEPGPHAYGIGRWPMMTVLVHGELIDFRQGDAQVEVIG